MTKPIDIRQIILDRLVEWNWSRYDLCHRINKAHPEVAISRAMIYQYLSGTKDMTGRRLALLLEVLSLPIVPAESLQMRSRCRCEVAVNAESL